MRKEDNFGTCPDDDLVESSKMVPGGQKYLEKRIKRQPLEGKCGEAFQSKR